MDANEWMDGCAGVKAQAQAPASGPREGNVSRSGDVLYWTPTGSRPRPIRIGPCAETGRTASAS